MGNCASAQYTTKGGDNLIKWTAATAKIIHLDGKLQEVRQQIKARHILSQNPNCFLASSESMYIGSQVPHVPEDEELQLGQIYFLIPLSKSQETLTLKDLCSLAVKASTALPDRLTPNEIHYKYPPRPTFRGCCEVPIGFQVPEKRNQGIDF